MCQVNETELSDELRALHAACSVTLAVVGTFGNAMSLILICKARLYQDSPVIMLITDLCVANLLSTGLFLPIVFATGFYNWWVPDDLFCKAFGYIIHVAVCSECLIITNLALCQYLVVVHSVQIKTIILNHRKCLNLFILLMLPWVIAASLFLVPLTETWDTFGYDPRYGFCTLINKQNGIGMLAVGSIIVISIMTVILLYCYPAILYTYIKSHSTTRCSTLAAGTGMKSQSKKLQFMISTIIINYLVTYFPFLIVNIADPCLTKIPLSAYIAIFYIWWSHVAINPFIYALLNTKIKVLWKKNFQCLQSITGSSLTSSSLVVRRRRRNMVVMETSKDQVKVDAAI